ncbi:MAG TPA: bifunctional diguanylate cyclase/phosphodiesterase [Frateuria sp.]|uniref:putative bifunctional diguanylate cyclase/phosphodiesterase n=1 Tax=Frateuria sp. TaxID=2211372 RepID=UPI002D7F8350|nr:bifunctional diguanylate cyclase/phosphodiesterase [Frateuria sp.]HET6804429.1 bifunctional diguanylate cyclase/phosphodiesterase [Frateuria sp.]
MLNRAGIFDFIDRQLAPAAAADDHVAVIMLRVEGLREVSLRFGYATGEQAHLRALEMIRGALRPVDRVFSAGDDHFVLVLPRLHGRNHVLLAATRLIQTFEAPLPGLPYPLQGRPEMGVALYPGHAETPDLLCRRAELALAAAHARGESCQFYEPQDTPEEIFYEELREAIEANRLCAWFQPVWDLQRGTIVGVESLARWPSPRLGLVSPASFVEFAEQSDLILALTRWSISATLRHAASLRGAPGLTFAINFSPRVFARPGLVEQLMDVLEIWGLPPSVVVAEITETALVNDLQASAQAMQRMRERGVRIAIDDFGTGYASIAYLRRFPASELKIDRSLVCDLTSDPRTATLVQSIIQMAHHMEMTTVAEGVEDQATQELLTTMGCDYAQGYHLGRPEPAGDFVARYAQAHTPA